MAAPYNPPVKNEDFVIYIALVDTSDPSSFKADPTIAEGDFKVGQDDGSMSNLSTLPTLSPPGSPSIGTIWVKLTLSSAEMNGDVVKIQGIDQTDPKEWSDFALAIPTTSA